jgi:dienelactone hydrolase
MRFTSQASTDGVLEQSFTLGEVPGVLFTPPDATVSRPLILMGHGGGMHKRAPAVLAGAHRFARAGFAVAAIDAPNHGDRPKSEGFVSFATQMRGRMAAGEHPAALVATMHELLAEQAVADWQAVLDALEQFDHVRAGPVGYWGMSMGCGLGVPLVAAEPRIAAAVIGLLGVTGLSQTAAKIIVPVRFLLQWDDTRVRRGEALALFDALGSPVKSLHANPGDHGGIPDSETDSALRFFTRHLG